MKTFGARVSSVTANRQRIGLGETKTENRKEIGSATTKNKKQEWAWSSNNKTEQTGKGLDLVRQNSEQARD